MKKFSSDKNVEYLLAISLLTRTEFSVAISDSMGVVSSILDLLKYISPNSKWSLKNSTLTFQPGPLLGGKHTLKLKRISDILNFFCIAATFSMEKTVLNITGITDEIEKFTVAYSKVLRWFQIDKMSVTVKKRGFSPEGEGNVLITAEPKRKIQSIDKRDSEKIHKLSGLVVTARISADVSQRMVKKIKKSLGGLGVARIGTVVNNRSNSGPSPGYECVVYLETKNGVFYSLGANNESPENTARQCCLDVLREVEKGGVVDAKLVPLVVVFMALSDGISRLKIGTLDGDVSELAKTLNEFLGAEHKMEDGNLVFVGCNYANVFKPL